MIILPSFSFLNEEKEYFLSHDLSFLPLGFVQRIGELSGAGNMNHLDDVLRY